MVDVKRPRTCVVSQDRNESISSNSPQVYTGVTYTQTTKRLALNIIQDGFDLAAEDMGERASFVTSLTCNLCMERVDLGDEAVSSRPEPKHPRRLPVRYSAKVNYRQDQSTDLGTKPSGSLSSPSQVLARSTDIPVLLSPITETMRTGSPREKCASNPFG